MRRDDIERCEVFVVVRERLKDEREPTTAHIIPFQRDLLEREREREKARERFCSFVSKRVV